MNIDQLMPISMYGADWCGDCRRAKASFAGNGILFESVDVDLDDRNFVRTACGTVKTNVDGFLAAGDCRHGAIAQVAAATSEGVIASYGVRQYLS